jgi:selenocysteine lyase/cysteine desulfurase
LLSGGWAELMQQNHAKALVIRGRLCQMVQVTQTEVPVTLWNGIWHRLIRVSAQIYNTQADYDVLARALAILLAEESKTVR